MFLQVLSLLVFASLSYAQVPGFGKCPDVTVQQNFDLKKYLGGWYEVEKFFFVIEGDEVCITANYSLKDDGHVEVYNTGRKSDGTSDVAIGDATIPDASEPAKFAVSFNGSPRVPYWVVKTDYDNYSLVWSCTDVLGVVQADFAWILSRNPTLDADTVKMLKDTLAAYKINTSKFAATTQDSC